VTAVVTAYAAEIYPTMIRSRGTGLIAGLTKAGGVLVLAIVLATVPTPSLGVTALIGALPLLAAIAVFARTAPDTRQRTLEEITEAELAAAGGVATRSA
jgi:putative MFS transporter